MNQIIKQIACKITSGRPMIKEGYAFTDSVAGRPVYYWRDRLGRRWMANGAWSLFRVPRNIRAG